MIFNDNTFFYRRLNVKKLAFKLHLVKLKSFLSFIISHYGYTANYIVNFSIKQ